MKELGVRAAWRFAQLAALVVSLAAAQCQGEPSIDPRIWRMVRCIECRDGEQAAVLAMRESAIPGLRYFLINGPPDSTLARQDSALRAPYHTGGGGRGGRGGRGGGGGGGGGGGRGGRSGTPGFISPPSQVVQRRLDDFAAMYRMRSSLALGLIGGDSARRTLCLARTKQFRADVQRVIDSALVLLQGNCQ